MARVAEAVPQTFTGLYGFLVDREEEAHRQPGGVLPWKPGRPRYDSRPERLEAARAGQPIDLPLSELPSWARPTDVDDRAGWHRAVVAPGDTIAVYVDSGEMWLREAGLW